VRLPVWVVLAIGLAFLVVVVLTRSLPYGLVPPLVVGWLAGQHVSSPAASGLSKRVVVLVTVWATGLAATLPIAAIPGVVTLAAVGVYILFHQIVTSHKA
jgi:hypothetical protein